LLQLLQALAEPGPDLTTGELAQQRSLPARSSMSTVYDAVLRATALCTRSVDLPVVVVVVIVVVVVVGRRASSSGRRGQSAIVADGPSQMAPRLQATRVAANQRHSHMPPGGICEQRHMDRLEVISSRW